MLRLDRRDNTHFDEPAAQREADTARLWLSEQQWLSLLERVERGEPPATANLAGGASEATGQRGFARHALSFRCVIRLAPPSQMQADHGTYLIHSRNLSAGGMGFVHDAPLHPGTRCTVGLSPEAGRGMIVPARVAWCRPLAEHSHLRALHEVGVQFDQPVDVDPFLPAA